MKKEGQVVESLLSGDLEKIRLALEDIKKSDNVHYVQPLVALWVDAMDPEIKEVTLSMLNTLKVKGFEEELMICLRKTAWKNHFGAIMAFMWNSGGNPYSFLVELIRIALENGPETMLECFSIIEVMDGPLPEEQLIEAQSLLHEAHQNERDEYLKNLIALLSNAIADKEVDID
jgi:hypothetical protein